VVRFSGAHSKKIMLQNTPALDVAATAALGRVNEASCPMLL
jgi:hypothetical protein